MDIEKEIRKARRWHWMIASVILFVVVCWGYLLCQAVSSWFGNTRLGASVRLDSAMKAGDGDTAVFYGERLVKKFTSDDGRIESSSAVHRLAMAYEINGQYQEALDLLNRHAKDGSYRADLARIYFKQGKAEESFELYGALIPTRDTQGTNNIRYFYESIMRMPYSIESPFPSCTDFVAFMESEYEKLGKPKKYADAMERIRQSRDEFETK